MARASTVAVVVPSPAASLVFWATALTSLAPMFSNGIGEVDLLGDRDAVLGDGRTAEGLVDDDVSAGRPEGDARPRGPASRPRSGASSGRHRYRAVAWP